MIKILYLCESLEIGGAEQLLLTTLKYLNRNKFLPVVYCLREKGKIGEEVEKIGIPVRALNKKPYLWNLVIIGDLVKIFKREKPDILHTHLFYPNYFGRIAAIFTKIPVLIITEHGTHSNFKKFYHHLVDFILSLFTTRIIAVSRAVKEYLHRYTLIPSHKIVVIYNAIDFDRFDNAYRIDKVAARKKLGFSNAHFLIGCISNLAPWKGQLVLLQAFSEVIKVFANAKLCIVGRNNVSFQHKLETFAKKNGFRQSVSFLGERRDVPEILRALDIFVLPSFTEGLGISLIEAMYMGIPSVASQREGILEIIENGKDGILVPAGNSQALAEGILALLKDNHKTKSICLRAMEKAKVLFSPDTYIKKLELCYQRN